MVLIWIGLAIGIIIVSILIIKAIKTPSHEAISFASHCKKCGFKINGLKCPHCDKSFSTSNSFK